MSRKEVNLKIRSSWVTDFRKVVERKKLHKKTVPSFTRHNGNRIRKLKDAWRRSKGSQGNHIRSPCIGYKRKQIHRYRRASDGLLIRVVHNQKDLLNLKHRAPYEVACFSRKLGGKKRERLMELAMKERVPVYISNIQSR